MTINKIKAELLSKYYKDEYDDLDDSSFADATNRLFPLDNLHHVEDSLELLKNPELLGAYSPQEQLLICDRVLAEASKNEIDLSDFTKELLIKGEKEGEGGQNMTREEMINSPEFKEAVEAAVKERLTQNDTQKELVNLKDELAKANEKVTNLSNELQAKSDEVAKAQSDFEAYKGSVEKEKVAQTRWADLQAKGFEFKDSAEAVKKMLPELSGEAYDNYVKMLTEARGPQVKQPDKDPVKASETVIPQVATETTASEKEDGGLVAVAKIFGMNINETK